VVSIKLLISGTAIQAQERKQMDIIVVSNRFTQARSFTISVPQVIFLSLLFTMVVVSLAVLLNYFSLRHAVTNQSPYLQSLLETVQAEQSRHTQSYLRESLNTMAARLGEMQAKLLRLDSLGDRLSKLAGLNPKEFMFDQARHAAAPHREARLRNCPWRNWSVRWSCWGSNWMIAATSWACSNPI
jgi:hypothetical protein